MSDVDSYQEQQIEKPNRQRPPTEPEQPSRTSSAFRHPITVAFVSFVLVVVLGGTLQQNYQQKSFVLSAQLEALDQMIDGSLFVQENIRKLSDESGLAPDLSPREMAALFEVRHVIDRMATDFQQVDGRLDEVNGEFSYAKRFQTAVSCVATRIDGAQMGNCHTHIVLDANDATVFAGRLKREFLEQAAASTGVWSYLKSFF